MGSRSERGASHSVQHAHLEAKQNAPHARLCKQDDGDATVTNRKTPDPFHHRVHQNG
ncbi:hypothetical protein [Methylocella tundrae]|uniref:Uncharacterized protein n=1 Tax=Methylocella tundrae TaxID=227605 RepID=A0A4U8YWJ0_METTU|nr:hypothetical protein [Methylocella tundrae]WPP05043.1 hypothetical protein SIN04_04220 [Methylocella tundrae]VFU07340.1 protein of unknown function [Methylocella tundrae]